MPTKPLPNGKAKRHKKRKSRTEVSPDIPSSEDERPPSEMVNGAGRIDADAMDLDLDSVGQGNDIAKSSRAQSLSPPSRASSSSSPSPPPASTKIHPKTEVEISFEKFYMQKVAEEFAEDLDAVRGAGDFGDGALESLIEALRQGTGVFGAEEMRRIVGGVDKE